MMRATLVLAFCAAGCHLIAGLDEPVETGTNAAGGSSSSASASGSGPGNGGSGAAGGAGGDGLGGAACNIDEDNDTIGYATPVLAADTPDLHIVESWLRPGDVDWFRYDGADLVTATNPSVRVRVDMAGADVCAHVKCIGGAERAIIFRCPPGYAPAEDPELKLPGCCGVSDGTTLARFDVDCGAPNIGDADDARVYVKVSMGSLTQCERYYLSYGF